MAETAKTTTTPKTDKPKVKRLTGAERIAKMQAELDEARKKQAAKNTSIIVKLRDRVHKINERIVKDQATVALLEKQIKGLQKSG